VQLSLTRSGVYFHIFSTLKMNRSISMSSLCLLSIVGAGCNATEVSSPARPTIVTAGPPAPPDDPKPYPSNGPELVAFVAARHPERLVAGVGGDERIANMEFLRDQIIATGICGGLDLARNLKRGVGPHSIDAIAWRHQDGWVDVVDIAFSYDDTGSELRLQWMVADGPSGWDPIPAPECG
jgi:hypothetical protein